MSELISAPKSSIHLAGHFDPLDFPDGEAPGVEVLEDYSIVRRGDLFVCEAAVPNAADGTAGQVIQVNSGEDGYELADPSGGGIEKYINTASSSQVSGVGTFEYDISHSIPAGNLNELGKVLRVTLFGNHTGAGFQSTATYWRLKLGSTVLETTTTVSLLSSAVRRFSMSFIAVVRATGASGSVATNVQNFLFNDNVVGGLNPQSIVTVDLTAAHTLKVDVTWTGNGNLSYLRTFLAEII